MKNESWKRCELVLKKLQEHGCLRLIDYVAVKKIEADKYEIQARTESLTVPRAVLVTSMPQDIRSLVSERFVRIAKKEKPVPSEKISDGVSIILQDAPECNEVAKGAEECAHFMQPLPFFGQQDCSKKIGQAFE